MKKLYLFSLFCFVSVLAFSQSTSGIRSDGTILVNGQPFFPFGAYSIPFGETEASKTQALDDMIAAGFNISTVEDDGNDSTTMPMIKRLLTRAGNNNFKLLIGPTHAPNGIYPPQKYKTYPATFGYIVADDADNGKYTTTQLSQFNSNIKSHDNTHITFLTLTGWTATNRNDANSFTSIGDASGYQSYPITPPTGSDWGVAGAALKETYLRTLHYVKSAALVNRPMIMHLQTFNWNRTTGARYPTVSELRNMLYSGLAAGIKGVISYDYSFDLKNNQPALWNEFKALGTDVKSLEGVLMNGRLNRVNTGDQELVYSYWTDATGCYVVVVNTSYSTSKTVSLSTPPGFGSPMTSLFSRMPATLSLSGNTLSGNILAQGVQVYKLTRLDSVPPSAPSNLRTTNTGLSTITLAWDASTDNYGVANYDIFVGGVLKGNTTSTSIVLNNLNCGTAYSLTVKARDHAANVGAASAALSASTLSCDAPTTNIALNKTTFTSTKAGSNIGSKAVDGSASTYWSSQTEANSWIYVDLGSTADINRIQLNWAPTYFATNYLVQTSNDGSSWTTIQTLAGQDGALDNITGINTAARYVRIYVTARAAGAGYLRLRELEVYGILQGTQATLTSSAVNNTNRFGEEMELAAEASGGSVQIYPNPASDNVTITTGGDAEVSIASSFGAIMYQQKINKRAIVDVRQWSSGLYFFSIHANGKTVVKKVVIN